MPERAGSGAGAGPGRTPVALGTIERAGLYEVTGAAPGFERVAVNLLDENESSLRVGEALAQVRNKGMQSRPLDQISEGKVSAIKAANIVGLPLILLLIGLVRWRVRQSARFAAKL